MTRHSMSFLRDFLRDGVQADCTCGWVGPWMKNQEYAEETFIEHLHGLSEPDS